MAAIREGVKGERPGDIVAMEKVEQRVKGLGGTGRRNWERAGAAWQHGELRPLRILEQAVERG